MIKKRWQYFLLTTFLLKYIYLIRYILTAFLGSSERTRQRNSPGMKLLCSAAEMKTLWMEL